MNLSNLSKTTNRKPKRLGQGISAGGGKTAGRGTKGQKSRTGKKLRPGFEGGQMPLVQRIPKRRGFTSRNEKPTTLRVDVLNAFKENAKVSITTLIEARLIKKSVKKVKIVLGGELKKKLIIQVPASKSAVGAIEKAGGKIEK